MPRPNRPREIFAERHVAANVARLRREQTPPWSIEGLADRLTAAGCSIHASPLYKMEKADPPRRVTVDELVGFAIVFGVPLGELIEDPAKRIPAAFVNLQERMLMQIGIGNALAELVKSVDEGMGQLRKEWAELIESTAPEDRPGSVRPIDVVDAPHEAVEWQIAHTRYEREADKVLRSALAKMNSRSVKGGPR